MIAAVEEQQGRSREVEEKEVEGKHAGMDGVRTAQGSCAYNTVEETQN